MAQLALTPISIGHFFAGCMRGRHTARLMLVALNSPTSYFDGPPLVSCAAFCVHNGKLTEPADTFSHPFWNHVRDKVSRKFLEMREQDFSGAAMLPMSELGYTGVVEKLESLDASFVIRIEKMALAH
jgi:fructose 1,6-bisphosphate aldolase/phosphatase